MMKIGEKSKYIDGWYIVLRALHSNLIKARVGDDIFYTQNGRLVLSKIESIKKKLNAGGKVSPKPENCIVDFPFQDRVLK